MLQKDNATTYMKYLTTSYGNLFELNSRITERDLLPLPFNGFYSPATCK